jgi:hypothetical protein
VSAAFFVARNYGFRAFFKIPAAINLPLAGGSVFSAKLAAGYAH